jgi:hypothetical protein
MPKSHDKIVTKIFRLEVSAPRVSKAAQMRACIVEAPYSGSGVLVLDRARQRFGVQGHTSLLSCLSVGPQAAVLQSKGFSHTHTQVYHGKCHVS